MIKKTLKKEIKKIEQERDEYLAGWQRARADFINYKREMEQKASGWKEEGVITAVREFLEVIDSLERALYNKAQDKISEWYNGVERVYNQAQAILKRLNVEEIRPPNSFDDIDYALHEVLSSSGEAKEIEVFQKGYKYKDRVIRPVKIIFK